MLKFMALFAIFILSLVNPCSCFPITFLISIVKCTQQNLPLILFVCGVPVCVCICSATDVEVWGQPWVLVFTFCLVGGSISCCSLQAPDFNFWEFSYLHLSSLWRDTEVIDMCYYIQLLRGFWASKLRLACKFFLPTEPSPQPLF